MNIIRVEHCKNYTCIANNAIRDSRLTLKARGLHHVLLSYPDNWKISIDHLASSDISEHDGRTAIMNALKELEKFGYLTRKQIRNERGHITGWESVIRESPQSGFPIVGKTENRKNRKSEKPRSEKPRSDNQSLINNDLEEVSNYEVLPPTPHRGKEEVGKEEENVSYESGEGSNQELANRPSPNRESILVQPSQVSGEGKSSALHVATKNKSNLLQNCKNGANVINHLINDPYILDDDPVPRAIAQEMKLRGWLWPWWIDRKTICPEFLKFQASQMPSSDKPGDMSPERKAKCNILNREKTVKGLMLLLTEFETFKSGVLTTKPSGTEPLRPDFESRFSQAQRLEMVEGDWFRDALGQIRVRLFGGELVTQAKFMTLPLEKPKDLQTPEEVKALLDQVRHFQQQARERLHEARVKQSRGGTATAVLQNPPLVENVISIHERQAEIAIQQQLKEMNELLADLTLGRDSLTQARAESFVLKNSGRFKAVRGKDQLILMLEEPRF